MYEAVSLNTIMTLESQRLYRKATFSEGFLSLSTICLLQLKCNTPNVTDHYTTSYNRNLYIGPSYVCMCGIVLCFNKCQQQICLGDFR